jgi:hypothetical protein
LTKLIAWHFNGDGWAESIMRESCTQPFIISTAFREEIRGYSVCKRIPIYIKINNIFVRLRTAA